MTSKRREVCFTSSSSGGEKIIEMGEEKMETFFSLPGGSVDDANDDTAKNRPCRLDGAFLRARSKDLGEKKKCCILSFEG